MKRHTLFSPYAPIIIAMAAMIMGFASSARAENRPIDTNLPMAVRMSRSEMLRHPDYKTIDGNTKLKWNYTNGLLCQAIFAAYDYYHGDTLDCSDLYTYAKGYYEATINSQGTIYNYKESNYSLDHVNPGKNLFRLYEETGDARYLTAMKTLRKQLKNQPRTSDDGFWHKQNYPYQMWLDGLYMGTPYYARYARDFEDNPAASYADVIKQFNLVAQHTLDDHSGLYRHGWDEKRAQIWADKTTGQSQHVWGRALGWYTMALVDVLEILPDDTPDRESLLTILQGIFDRLPAYQDPETGAWYQVVDYPDSTDNYQEISCTAMFAYSIAKGVRLGYLDEALLPVAERAYQGICEHYLSFDAEGKTLLHQICSVAGLSSDRDGSYDYYVNQTKTIDNDPKGVGPFILLCIEMERIENEEQPSAVNNTPAQTLSAQLLPGRGEAEVHYLLPRQSDVEMTLIDPAGRRHDNIVLKNQPAGAHSQKLATHALPAGLYLLQIKADHEIITIKYTKP